MVTRQRRATAFPQQRPCLVAAIDLNHGGRLPVARRLVVQAAAAGAHAVKLSVRAGQPPDTVTASTSAAATGESRPLSAAAVAAVRREARGRLAFIAAPRDAEGLRVAKRLGPEAYQVDPPALSDLPLVRAIGRTRRPILLVAGMCSEATIAAALAALPPEGVTLMHTVTAAPLPPDRIRLGFLPALRKRFRRPVGYLGWEPGINWSLVAAAIGAGIIEKPFTLDHSLEGPLHAWSVGPEELRALAGALSILPHVLATPGRRRVLPEEVDQLARLGHCLVARRRLARGTRLRASHLRLEAPLRGIGPRLWQWLEGRRLIYDLEKGEPVTFGMIE